MTALHLHRYSREGATQRCESAQVAFSHFLSHPPAPHGTATTVSTLPSRSTTQRGPYERSQVLTHALEQEIADDAVAMLREMLRVERREAQSLIQLLLNACLQRDTAILDLHERMVECSRRTTCCSCKRTWQWPTAVPPGTQWWHTKRVTGCWKLSRPYRTVSLKLRSRPSMPSGTRRSRI